MEYVPTLILGLMLMICVYLLIVGIRIGREVELRAEESIALAKAALDAMSKLLQRKE